MRTALVAIVTALTVVALGLIGSQSVHTATAGTVTLAASTTAVSADPGPDARTVGDEGVALSEDLAVSAGVCRTFIGEITVFMCVPLYSPTGGILIGNVEEDGAASYTDGWNIDAETHQFYRAGTGDWYGTNY